MPVTRTCTFCGNDIEPGTGKMFIRKDGTIYFFCSGKCQKNMLNLRRIGRKVRWTRRYVKALQVRVPRRAERPRPKPAAVKVASAEDKETVLEAFSGIPGISRPVAEALWEAGHTSLEKLRTADEEELLKVKGIGPATLKKVLEHFKEGD
ncbi:MAG: 50S ribosomal protein L24e [Thermoplasmata archaeon]